MILYTREGKPQASNAFHKNKPVAYVSRPCVRCGGQGGAEKWRHTGWTCHRCGGKQVDPVNQMLRLYTEEQLVVLNARREKTRAAAAAKKAERDRLEQLRRDEDRLEMISANKELLDAIRKELTHGGHDLLESVRDYIAVKANMPSEAQVRAVNRVIEQRVEHRRIVAAAAHIGEIGDRVDLTLKLLYTRSDITGRFPTIYSHWSMFIDEHDRKVCSTSAPWSLGIIQELDEDKQLTYTRGQEIRLRATVKSHKFNKEGLPVTYIQRPHVIESEKAA